MQVVSLCGMDADGVAFLRADVERFCGELADLAPAARLRLVAELRAALDEVTTAALTSGMAAAKQEGWGLRRIGQVLAAPAAAGPPRDQVRDDALAFPPAAQQHIHQPPRHPQLRRGRIRRLQPDHARLG